MLPRTRLLLTTTTTALLIRPFSSLTTTTSFGSTFSVSQFDRSCSRRRHNNKQCFHHHSNNRGGLSLSQSGNGSWRGDMNSSTTLSGEGNIEQDIQQWTVCPACKGNGKVFKAPSRKARYRQKRAKLNQQQNDDDDGDEGDNNSISRNVNGIKNNISNNNYAQTSMRRIDPCQVCNKTGIIQQSNTMLPDRTSNSNSTNLPTVAIVGGGIGGIALGIACAHRSIPCTIYERDDHFYQRSQGYGLTMQQASRALSAFGIGISTPLKDGITSTKHIVHTPNGTEVGSWGLRKWGRGGRPQNDDAATKTKTKPKPPKRQNIHIARQALRHELLNALPFDICWGHKLIDCNFPTSPGEKESPQQQTMDDDNDNDSAADATTKNQTELVFQVGSNEKDIVRVKADVVVGADGIRSTVRKFLVGDDEGDGDNGSGGDPLRYLDCLVVLGICRLELLSESHLLDGETVFQTADGNTRIYVMPYSKTECMWQLSFPMDETKAKSLSKQGAAALKAEAIHKCHTWHDPILEILQQTPTELVSGYPVYDRALITSEALNNTFGVTLLGDAAHPMSPFKGQGANQALLDALSLARSLYTSFQSNGKKQTESQDISSKRSLINDSLKEYHDEMTCRSATKVEASAKAAQFLHTDVAIQQGDVTRGAAAATATVAES